jgi:DNA-binding NtrC family response regulator
MSNRSVNVLVVDDDIAVCRILHRMLSDEQYEVQISQSVADALRSIEEKHFDVYVMDYKLPDGTGLDVAERIRAKGSEAPIILISGYDPSAVALRAEKLHISDIIEKPFARATICNAVKKAIGFTAGAEQSEAGSGVPDVAEPGGSTGAASDPSKKKGISKATLVGIVVLLLLVFSVAVYVMMHVK